MAVFPDTLGVTFDKLASAIVAGEMSAKIALTLVIELTEMVEQFKTGLAACGDSDAVDAAGYHLLLIEHPLTELDTFFARPNDTHLTADDAYLHLFSIQDQVEELKAIAADIDGK